MTSCQYDAEEQKMLFTELHTTIVSNASLFFVVQPRCRDRVRRFRCSCRHCCYRYHIFPSSKRSLSSIRGGLYGDPFVLKVAYYGLRVFPALIGQWKDEWVWELLYHDPVTSSPQAFSSPTGSTSSPNARVKAGGNLTLVTVWKATDCGR
jgi:hypothetical protein